MVTKPNRKTKAYNKKRYSPDASLPTPDFHSQHDPLKFSGSSSVFASVVLRVVTCYQQTSSDNWVAHVDAKLGTKVKAA